MNYLGTILISDELTTEFNENHNSIVDIKKTMEWVKEQNEEYSNMFSEETLRHLDELIVKRKDLIKTIKAAAKNEYPSGTQIKVMLNSNAVEVYG